MNAHASELFVFKVDFLQLSFSKNLHHVVLQTNKPISLRNAANFSRA